MLPKKHFDKIEKEAIDMLKSSTDSSDSTHLPLLTEPAKTKKVVEINDNVIDNGNKSLKDDDYNYDDDYYDEADYGDDIVNVTAGPKVTAEPTAKPKLTSTKAPVKITTISTPVKPTESKIKLIPDTEADEVDDDIDEDSDTEDDDELVINTLNSYHIWRLTYGFLPTKVDDDEDITDSGSNFDEIESKKPSCPRDCTCSRNSNGFLVATCNRYV